MVGAFGAGLGVGWRSQRHERLGEATRVHEFESLVYNFPSALTIKNLDGQFTYVNACFVEWYGFDPSAAGRKTTEIWNCEVSQQMLALEAEVLESGEIRQLENRYTDGEGRHRELLTLKFPVWNGEGKVTAVGTIDTDVTQRWRLERALREKSRLLEATLESMDQGITMIDEQFRVTVFNERFMTLLRIPPDEFRAGEPVEKLVRFCAARGDYGGGDIEARVRQRLYEIHTADTHKKLRILRSGQVIESRTRQAPDGGLVITYADVTENHALTTELEHRARHDPLTGLVNRWGFENRLSRLLEREAPTTSEHVMCYLDLDHFKVINDSCGHHGGDQVLRELSGLLSQVVRKRDTFARLGGDEFAVLMEHCTLAQAQRVANAILTAVEQYRFSWLGQSFQLGVSIGIVPIVPGQEVADVLRNADTACYVAKDHGGSHVHVYESGDERVAQREADSAWISRINSALDDQRFCLYCQQMTPVGDRRGSSAKHYEILLRMRDENGAMISPDTFLPAAERHRMMRRIDRWAVEQTFSWLAAHSRHCDSVDAYSINLSGQSVGDARLTDFLIAQHAHVRPGQICFEITETAALHDASEAVRFINTLRACGYEFSLDDFGTGMASFAYLRSLPVDWVKIDGSFVRDINHNPVSLAMVRSINEIAHLMGKRTVAECVETPEPLAVLTSLGVDYVQGFAIHEPQPLEAILASSAA